MASQRSRIPPAPAFVVGDTVHLSREGLPSPVEIAVNQLTPQSVARVFSVRDRCMSAMLTVLCICMKSVCLVISPHNASGSREKKNGVGMALDVATLPLILYRRPGI